MFNLLKFQPKLVNRKDNNHNDNSRDCSKDQNSLIFFLSKKNNCVEFERKTGYSLENKKKLMMF